MFEEKYQCYLEEFRANPVSGRITDDDAEGHFFCYDAVWTIALGLDETDRYAWGYIPYQLETERVTY